MTISAFFLGSIAIFSFLCIILVLFFERTSPASSLVWILVLVFLPVIGFVCYLFLGSGFRLSKRKRYLFKAARDDLYNNYIVKRLNFSHSRIFSEEEQGAERVANYLRGQADGPVTDDNDVEIFTDGNDMFLRLFQDVRNAKHHVHVLFYIFRNDNIGKEFLAILTEKAKEGVEVRLIYDSIGTMMASDKPFRELMAAGGEVAAFSPLFSSLNSHLRLNYRNHRKVVVIDGIVGYVGGMNVGDEYLSRDPKMSPWRATHTRLAGSAVWFMQERFFMDWAYATGIDPEKVDVNLYFPDSVGLGDTPVQIVSSGPDTYESPIKSAMLGMIYAARKTVYIQTPYFAPDESFADALRIAAHSGVDVRLMISSLSDYRIVQCATLGYARDMQRYGVKIFSYEGFIHSKTVVVDGKVATIGTTNITNRSFTLDFEINAFFYSPEIGRQCEEIFLKDQINSVLVPEEFFKDKGILTRATYNFARMFAPMM